MDDIELVKEQIKAQIEITKEFTEELVSLNKILVNINDNIKELSKQFQNGFADKLYKRIEEMVKSSTHTLFLKIVGTSSILAAIFGFIVWVISKIYQGNIVQ